MLSRTRTGEVIILAEAALWGLFPIFTILTIGRLPPLFTAAIGTTLSSVFFATVLTWQRGWSFPRSTATWSDMLLATFFNGVVYYGLTFIAYRFTTAGNGAVVSLMEIFFTFVIVNLLTKHERFVPLHALGAVLMVVGALWILLPKWNGGTNVGDLIIVLAAVAAPVGNIFAQRARKRVSAQMLMFVRSAIGSVLLLLLAWIFEPIPTSSALNASWVLLLLNGVLLLGLAKILWLEAIHRLPLGKTIALSALGVPCTLLFAWLLLHQTPTAAQLLALLPMIGGVALLTRG